jgi:choline kinase
MQVVLLAAGLGSRLGALTTRLPKALIEVAGEPLLIHALRFARRLAPAEIIVVGGYGFPEVAMAVSGLGGALTLVENSHFRDGNLVSLFCARPRILGDFLLMNVDHIYRPEIATRVAPATDEVTAFIDVDRKLGADDMKVARDEAGRVRAIAKTLTEFDAGYVGMTRVPGPALERYFSVADGVLAREGKTVHVERVLAALAESDRRPECRDVSHIGWLEVDLADERAQAEAAIRQAPGEWL